MRHFSLLLIVAVLAVPTLAQQTRSVEYTVDGQTHIGYLAVPNDLEGDAPGVLVVPEWWGLNGFAKEKARQLAQLGYIAFAADMYGQGKMTNDPGEAGQWSSQARQPRTHWRALVRAAYDVLRDQDAVDGDRLAVIGFCFGGSTAVELAYANPPGLRAAVSFHGGPQPPLDSDVAPEASILILHGAQDPLDPPSNIMLVTDALSRLGANWQLHLFSGAQHSFTNPGADAYNIDGVAYNEGAALRAWEQMQLFFRHALGAE